MATNYITLLYISGKILWIVYIFGCKLKNSHWLQYGGLWENRTPLSAVTGPHPSRWTNRPYNFKIYLFGAPRRIWTLVTLVNSNQQLCQLSYRGINHEGGNPHIIYGLDAFGQFCRIFHHHHVSHASAAALSIRRSVRSVSPKSFFANWRRLYFLRKIFEKAGNP